MLHFTGYALLFVFSGNNSNIGLSLSTESIAKPDGPVFIVLLSADNVNVVRLDPRLIVDRSAAEDVVGCSGLVIGCIVSEEETEDVVGCIVPEEETNCPTNCPMLSYITTILPGEEGKRGREG